MKGKIVVVPFPFTDLSSIKRRPALVLHETKYDIVVAYISSIMPSFISPEDVLISQTRPSFVGTGLLSDSVIMLDKLATVEKSLIVSILGEVDNDLKAEINPKLAACYRLWEIEPIKSIRWNEIEYNVSHESIWWIRRREAKVNWM
jgi:mRNA interferase MazF